ncbi:PQ-loop domain-containing transporter [Nanoarchaeota archaeon]
MPVDIQHMHKRKIVCEKTEKYPHPHKGVRFLDNLLLVIAIIGPLANLPQILRIFSLKNAMGVSVWTFSLYALFDFPWIAYGIVHKEKPIIIAYSLWLITNLIVITGALIYS